MEEIVGIAAISIDGFITKHDQEGVAFASDEDQQFFRSALKQFDCCIFGSKTFLASKTGILRNLNAERLRIVLTRSPEQYVAYQHPDRLEFSNASPEAIVADLQQRGKKRCAILGGSEVYTLFLKKHLLHKLWVTVEPKLFGKGKKLVDAEVDVALELQEMLQLSTNTILLKYIVMSSG